MHIELAKQSAGDHVLGRDVWSLPHIYEHAACSTYARSTTYFGELHSTGMLCYNQDGGASQVRT